MSVHIHSEFEVIAFRGIQILLFVQSQRCKFQIGKNGGPTLFPKSFDCGAPADL
jgi:hypothetical protein